MIKAAHNQPDDTREPPKGISSLLPVEGRNGYVFLMADISKNHESVDLLFQILTEQVHRLVASFGKDANPQHRFEQFLGSLNETLAEHVREGDWNIPIDDFHAVVGLAVEEQMFLSGTGELTVLFFHKQVADRYQILNLSRSIQTEQTLPTWEKPFAVVLDGDLHEEDVFCLSNQELQREIPSDELNALLTTLPPTGAIEKIRQYFSIKDPVMLMVIKVGDKIAPLKEGYAKTLSDLSVEKMVDNELETAQLLEDRKPKIGSMLMWVFEKVMARKMASRLLQDLRKTQPNWKTIVQIATKSGRATWKYMKRLSGKTMQLAFALGKKDGQKKILKNAAIASRTVSKRTANLRHRVTGAPRSTKYLVSGVIVAVIVLTLSITQLSKSQARSAELKAYNEKLAAIEDVMERAAGAVIYKDENQARSLYVNATALVDSLPTQTDEQRAKMTTLKADIETAMNELRHMVTIPNPALLGDLAALSDGIFGNALVEDGDMLYVFGSDNRVHALDRVQKTFKPASTQLTSESSVIAASADDGQIYAVTTTGVIQFSPNKQEQTLLEVTDFKPAVDVMAYANRLYLLETSEQGEGQLYRYGRTGSGFGSPTKWIEAKTTELSKVSSLTIDGTVYVLKKDGTVLKYLNGSEVSWNMGVVDPPLTAASDIWTDADSTFLYILEPTTKRLVIFKKETGEFVVQYRSEAFQELTDFVVDEKDYSIYLLTGSKLYSIAASHLK